MAKKTYISIFAGCGGLSLGFKNSGLWQGLFAIEKNSDAFQTLNHNLISKGHYSWTDWLNRSHLNIDDVLNEHKKNLSALKGKIDLIAGGPPCQGFSTAGKRKEADSRNLMINSYIKFIKLVQPKAIFFENVKGFTQRFNAHKLKGDNYSEILIKKLSQSTPTCPGYRIKFQLVNFKDFGVPQNRTRFILIGIRKDIKEQSSIESFFDDLHNNREKFLEKKGLSTQTNLKSALSDLNIKKLIPSLDTPGFHSSIYGKATTNYQKYLRRNIESINPDSHRFAKHRDETIEKFSYILRNSLPGKNISEEIKAKFGLKKRNVTPLSEKGQAPTLTTLPDDYIHYKEPRILTVREYARIQSFDDCFEFKGKYTTGGKLRTSEVPRYTQIGNAIPPLFAEAVANELSALL